MTPIGTRTQPEVMRTKAPALTPVRPTRRCYLAEVKLTVAESELSWISTSLNTACRRLRGSGRRPQVLSVAYIPDDDRLSCLVEAGCVEDVHRLFGVALLPSVRVFDATVVALRAPRPDGFARSEPTLARPSAQPPPSS